jgi:hypothetical protein
MWGVRLRRSPPKGASQLDDSNCHDVWKTASPNGDTSNNNEPLVTALRVCANEGSKPPRRTLFKVVLDITRNLAGDIA